MRLTRLQITHLWRNTQTSPRCSVLSKCRAVSRYTRKCIKHAFPCSSFNENDKCWTELNADFCFEFHPSGQKMWKVTRVNLFTAPSKETLRQFLRSSEWLDRFLWIRPVSILFKFDKNVNNMTKFTFSSLSNVCLSLHGMFDEYLKCSMAWCLDLVYRSSPHSNKKYGKCT